STAWAQGGLAAAIGEDDSADLHAADTLAAGDGLCDERIARRYSAAAPAAIEALTALGVRFDRLADGRFGLGLEAAHSRRRIVHAGGDATGRELLRALAEAARRTPSIQFLEGVEARRLIVEDGVVCGVAARGAGGDLVFATQAVVLATGGVGALYDVSTNPLGGVGQGLALAARAGARLADLEFVQFHPTALDVGARPAPLVSEAVRGEGAILVDDSGERFMTDVPGGELAPRDVVARAVWRRAKEGRRVFLDARRALGPSFAARFPAIAAICAQHGIDPSRDLVPIQAAEHFHMGGVEVDGAGRSSLAGLWACGEVACTGLHGANRLASNSLMEAAVFAKWVAEDIDGAAPVSRAVRPVLGPSTPSQNAFQVRSILSRAAGVERNAEELRRGISALLPLAAAADSAAVALAICVAALRREESRGAHARTDFPVRSPAAIRSSLTFADAFAFARALPMTPLARSA
ncbi:MAG TPA: L-aspartate oxidase, partial [Roseiarcus sp.]